MKSGREAHGIRAPDFAMVLRMEVVFHRVKKKMIVSAIHGAAQKNTFVSPWAVRVQAEENHMR